MTVMPRLRPIWMIAVAMAAESRSAGRSLTKLRSIFILSIGSSFRWPSDE